MSNWLLKMINPSTLFVLSLCILPMLPSLYQTVTQQFAVSCMLMGLLESQIKSQYLQCNGPAKTTAKPQTNCLLDTSRSKKMSQVTID